MEHITQETRYRWENKKKDTKRKRMCDCAMDSTD
jgi:hypothetical protein